MARYPGAAWRPISKNYSPGGNRVDTVQFHTASDGPSTKTLWGWFNGGAHASAHFYVGQDGHVEQYVDTNDRAWAAYSSNSHAVSIETWDGGNNARPWNQAQVDALAALADWVCATHGVKRALCTSPGSGGVGWHEMFKEWNRSSHDCPGSVREAQVRDVILPRLNRAGVPLNPGDDVTPEQWQYIQVMNQKLDRIEAGVSGVQVGVEGTNKVLGVNSDSFIGRIADAVAKRLGHS